MSDLYTRAQAMLGELTACRRTLHQRPELAMEERQTAQYIEEQLDRLHIPHRRVGETGVMGILQGEQPAAM